MQQQPQIFRLHFAQDGEALSLLWADYEQNRKLRNWKEFSRHAPEVGFAEILVDLLQAFVDNFRLADNPGVKQGAKGISQYRSGETFYERTSGTGALGDPQGVNIRLFGHRVRNQPFDHRDLDGVVHAETCNHGVNKYRKQLPPSQWLES